MDPLKIVAILVSMLAVSRVVPSFAQTTSTVPSSRPAATSTAPASAPALDANAKAVLDALEKAYDVHKTIQADVEFLVEFRDVGDTEARTGSVVFRRGDHNTPDKFRIAFDTIRLGDGPKVAEKVEYAFDGQWLTVVKHKIKQVDRYQVAAKGEKVEPLRIGKGPFPLPFGQKTQDVLKNFDVRTRATKPKEPNDTDYLRLITRPESRKEINFAVLEMWVDRKLNLPVRIISEERKLNRGKEETTKVTTVDLKNVQTNVEVKPETFLLPCPPGWTLNVKRLGED